MRWMVGLVVGLTTATSVGVALVPKGDGTRDSVVRYRVEGNLGSRIRKTTGPVTGWVQGVPAAPVDSFLYDGVGVEPVNGHVVLECDPVSNTGDLRAAWVDEHGEWTLDMRLWLHPEHPSGVRIEKTVTQVDTVINDPIVTNVYLHGDTNAGQPVMPTLYSFVAAWGLSEVRLNGDVFRNPFDGVALPLWDTHIMVTAGARDINDGTVRTWDGRIYNMNEGNNGLQDHDDIEFHLVFHDGRYPLDMTNFPPLFQFFYHLNFEAVKLQIKNSQPLAR